MNYFVVILPHPLSKSDQFIKKIFCFFNKIFEMIRLNATTKTSVTNSFFYLIVDCISLLCPVIVTLPLWFREYNQYK